MKLMWPIRESGTSCQGQCLFFLLRNKLEENWVSTGPLGLAMF